MKTRCKLCDKQVEPNLNHVCWEGRMCAKCRTPMTKIVLFTGEAWHCHVCANECEHGTPWPTKTCQKCQDALWDGSLSFQLIMTAQETDKPQYQMNIGICQCAENTGTFYQAGWGFRCKSCGGRIK